MELSGPSTERARRRLSQVKTRVAIEAFVAMVIQTAAERLQAARRTDCFSRQNGLDSACGVLRQPLGDLRISGDTNVLIDAVRPTTAETGTIARVRSCAWEKASTERGSIGTTPSFRA